jgi:hypothetical protein
MSTLRPASPRRGFLGMSEGNPESDQLVAVINSDMRLFHLSYLEPRAQLKDASDMPIVQIRNPSVTRLVPGLNYVLLSVLTKAGFDPGHYRGALRVQDPAQMSDYEAAALAAMTSSRQALNHWQTVETRKMVKAAITKRLTSRKVKDMAE